MKDSVKIFDTALRDGEQTTRRHDERCGKGKNCSQLEKLHVDLIEAWFPIHWKGIWRPSGRLLRSSSAARWLLWLEPIHGISIGHGNLKGGQVTLHPCFYLYLEHSPQIPA